MTLQRLCFPALAALLTACAVTDQRPSSPAPLPVPVKILAINDFHGNLLPPPGGIRIKDPAHPGAKIAVPAGGAEHMATLVDSLRAKNANHVFVAAGDLIGATPLLSALFHDEPTIESLSLMGLEISAVGNHEFDRGVVELLRMQNGGCHPDDGCKGPQAFSGANFHYLAASTVDRRSGKTLFPAYQVKRFAGIPVAFIGLTLKATPSIVTPAGVAGWQFLDEAQTVNELVPQLQAQGIETIVVLIHEGGVPSGDYNECPGISGAIVDIVHALDKAVDVVVSGHTHRAYNCRIDDRLVTSGDKYGTLVTEIDLLLDPQSGDVLSASADNHLVRSEVLARDPAQTQLIAAYQERAAPLAKRVVRHSGTPLSLAANAAGEFALGQVIADAQLAATQAVADGGAQIALMNPGGVRTPLPGDALRYEDLFAVQPFRNQLVTMTLSGAQLLQLLEQQWGPSKTRVLQVSRGFHYRWQPRQPIGQRIVPGSVTLDGRPLDPTANYRVTVNSYLAGGGDNFSVLLQGRNRRTGIMDVDALEQYLAKHPEISTGRLNRIERLE